MPKLTLAVLVDIYDAPFNYVRTPFRGTSTPCLIEQPWIQKTIKRKWFVMQEEYRNRESLGAVLW